LQKSSDYFIELFDETSNVRKRNLNNNDDIDYKNTIDASNNLIDWISSMIISMYSEYDYIPVNHKSINEEALSGKERYYLTMFVLTIWNKDKFASLKDAFSKLLDNPVLYDEIIMLLKYKKSIIKTISSDITLPYVSSLSLHSRYTQAEALAGVGYFDLQNNHTIQTGVLYIKDKKTDVFFITLNKNEKDYSPTTMYNDYAINENLFHWQSQASTRIDSETGQRYINHIDKNQTIILFVRVNKSINSLSQPYYFLGPVDYVSHEGEKPINFVWQLKYPMPAHLLRETARLVVG